MANCRSRHRRRPSECANELGCCQTTQAGVGGSREQVLVERSGRRRRSRRRDVGGRGIECGQDRGHSVGDRLESGRDRARRVRLQATENRRRPGGQGSSPGFVVVVAPRGRRRHAPALGGLGSYGRKGDGRLSCCAWVLTACVLLARHYVGGSNGRLNKAPDGQTGGQQGGLCVLEVVEGLVFHGVKVLEERPRKGSLTLLLAKLLEPLGEVGELEASALGVGVLGLKRRQLGLGLGPPAGSSTRPRHSPSRGLTGARPRRPRRACDRGRP